MASSHCPLAVWYFSLDHSHHTHFLIIILNETGINISLTQLWASSTLTIQFGLVGITLSLVVIEHLFSDELSSFFRCFVSSVWRIKHQERWHNFKINYFWYVLLCSKLSWWWWQLITHFLQKNISFASTEIYRMHRHKNNPLFGLNRNKNGCCSPFQLLYKTNLLIWI